MGKFHDLLNFEIAQLGMTPLTLASILMFCGIFIITMLISKWTRIAIDRGMKARGVTEEGTTVTINRLVHYLILALGIGVGLQTIGIQLSALFAAGAVVAVGIGFALQNVTQNFVSGILLLVERSIKPGDILEVEGQVVRVVDMAIRSTIVRTRYEEHLILPNSTLVAGTVKNFSYENRQLRIVAMVGVHYDSDLRVANKALEGAASEYPDRLDEKDPVVILREFGDSSVNFEVSVWIDTPWDARRHRSKLLFAMWDALKAADVVIAYPQMDVHLDPQIVDAMKSKPTIHAKAA